MKYFRIYNIAKSFLLDHELIDEDDLNQIISPEKRRIKPKSLDEINYSLLSSAQNVQSSPNVIGKTISNIKGEIRPLEKVLFNFNPQLIKEHYGTLNDEELFQILDLEFDISKRRTKLIKWRRYCKTILSASKFLSQFNSHIEFYSFVDKFYKDKDLRPFLPVKIKFEIYGIGFALACDFLKEMGYTGYSKPDTHTKDILIELGFVSNKQKNSIEADYFSYMEMEKIASFNKVTPYEVDKILWLIGSGAFYLSDKNIEKQKKEFIRLAKIKLNET